MIIDHYYKYIFIAVPKTASISISFSLGHGDNIPEPDLYHQSLQNVLDEHQGYRHYYKFAFVRNPWARLVSLYYDFTKKRVKQYSALIAHEQPLFSEFVDFEDFCLRVQDTPWWSNIFLKSQTELLSYNNRLAMDYYGRFECLTKDFMTICGQLDIKGVTLQEMNSGTYDRTSHRKHFSERAANAVATLYKDDIENFSYEF